MDFKYFKYSENKDPQAIDTAFFIKDKNTQQINPGKKTKESIILNVDRKNIKKYCIFFSYFSFHSLHSLLFHLIYRVFRRFSTRIEWMEKVKWFIQLYKITIHFNFIYLSFCPSILLMFVMLLLLFPHFISHLFTCFSFIWVFVLGFFFSFST